MAPEFLALEVIADKAARAKITHHALAIGRRCGGGGAALGAVKDFEIVRLQSARPGKFTILTMIAAGLKFIVGEGCE